MAIQFSKLADQYIDFGTLATVRNLPQKTICAWINLDSIAATYSVIAEAGRDGGASDEYWAFVVFPNGKLYFYSYWSNIPLWHSSGAISTGVTNLICVSYDKSSSANHPVFSINGVDQVTTEDAAPSGTYASGTGGVFRLNIHDADSSYRLDGKIYALMVYPRILTPAEIADNFNTRNKIKPYNPVFDPVLIGCAGCTQDFWNSGGTLAAANTIRDRVSGVDGVPSGSPIMLGDNCLNGF